MKIAITSDEKDINGNVSEVFGRCKYFVIVNVEDKEITSFGAVENINAQKLGSAGVSAAQAVLDKKVDVVITGNVGPRALDVFKQFKVDVYISKGKIKEVVKQFIEGKLEKFER